MKKVSYSLVLIAISIAIIFGVYKFMKNYKEENGDYETSKYIYKDQLKTIGYTEDEISVIKDNFNESEVTKYLLDEKYTDLIKYMKSEAFNIVNIERYVKYDSKTSYSQTEVVTYVEIGLDQEFYTNLKIVDNTDDKLVLINKFNKLPDNFEATDLVDLEGDYSTNEKMKKVAAENMKAMIDAAKKDGESLKVVSGYRTDSKQDSLFNNSIKKNGEEHALKYSAKKGHSEHQTGYAADLNSTEESFKETSQYKWLKSNAHKYGFIERYPEGKEFITGYGYEPWHYRYVGVEVATIIYTKDITFEEYSVLY